MLKNARLGQVRNRDLLIRLLEKNGIPAERVLLEGPSDHYRFIEAYGRVDLALDTFPYNGGTTTTEALWQGVPVITFRGDRWASRTSASILDAAGLGDFVARDREDYVDLAVRVASAPDACDRLAVLRQGMRPHLRDAPICDTRGFARNMERIYTEIRPRCGADAQHSSLDSMRPP
jgi:predicted O-linked N-acetylglucosamine transferase (SPINDLY family)